MELYLPTTAKVLALHYLVRLRGAMLQVHPKWDLWSGRHCTEKPYPTILFSIPLQTYIASSLLPPRSSLLGMDAMASTNSVRILKKKIPVINY